MHEEWPMPPIMVVVFVQARMQGGVGEADPGVRVCMGGTINLFKLFM